MSWYDFLFFIFTFPVLLELGLIFNLTSIINIFSKVIKLPSFSRIAQFAVLPLSGTDQEIGKSDKINTSNLSPDVSNNLTDNQTGAIRTTKNYNRYRPYYSSNLVNNEDKIVLPAQASATTGRPLRPTHVNLKSVAPEVSDYSKERLKKCLEFDFSKPLKPELEETKPRIKKHQKLVIAELAKQKLKEIPGADFSAGQSFTPTLASGSGLTLKDKAGIVTSSASFLNTVKVPDLSDLREDFTDIQKIGITPPTHPRDSVEGIKERTNLIEKFYTYSFVFKDEKSIEKQEELKQILITSWVYLLNLHQREVIENSHLDKNLLNQ